MPPISPVAAATACKLMVEFVTATAASAKGVANLMKNEQNDTMDQDECNESLCIETYMKLQALETSKVGVAPLCVALCVVLSEVSCQVETR